MVPNTPRHFKYRIGGENNAHAIYFNVVENFRVNTSRIITTPGPITIVL